jgi:GxxExxY protein
VKQQTTIDVVYKNFIVGDYRSDLFIESKILIELKAEKVYNSGHESQVINYLKATGIKVGYLLNFGKHKLEFKRLVF